MKGNIELKKIGFTDETEPTLRVIDGKIFVEGVETIDAELIGMAFKDFAEGLILYNLDAKLHLNEDIKIIEFIGTTEFNKVILD